MCLLVSSLLLPFPLKRWKRSKRFAQLTGLTCMCSALCTANVLAWQKPLPHSVHLNGFSFEWMYLKGGKRLQKTWKASAKIEACDVAKTAGLCFVEKVLCTVTTWKRSRRVQKKFFFLWTEILVTIIVLTCGHGGGPAGGMLCHKYHRNRVARQCESSRGSAGCRTSWSGARKTDRCIASSLCKNTILRYGTTATCAQHGSNAFVTTTGPQIVLSTILAFWAWNERTTDLAGPRPLGLRCRRVVTGGGWKALLLGSYLKENAN